MKFSTREDISAPVDRVFQALCDFEGFERQAMRRGVEVKRTDALAQAGVGMCWRVAFEMRGRKRDYQIELKRFDAPNEMAFEATSAGIEAAFLIELIALSRSRTRISMALDITPLNLSARLLVQSLKLAKTTLTKKFKLRVADYTRSLEERLQRSA